MSTIDHIRSEIERSQEKFKNSDPKTRNTEKHRKRIETMRNLIKSIKDSNTRRNKAIANKATTPNSQLPSQKARTGGGMVMNKNAGELSHVKKHEPGPVHTFKPLKQYGKFTKAMRITDKNKNAQAESVEVSNVEQIDEISSDMVKKARDSAFAKGKDDQAFRFVKKAYEKGKKESDAIGKKMAEEVKEPTGGLKDACWKGYTAVGMKMKNGKKVPNCVPQEGVIQPDGTDKVGQYEESDFNVKVTHKTATGEVAHKIYKVVKAKDHRHAQNIALNKHISALDKAGTKFVGATSSVMKEEVQIDETVESPVVDTSSDYNIAKSIMRYSDMMKMLGKKPIEKAAGAYQDENFENFPEQKKDTESDMDAEVGNKAEPQTQSGNLMSPPLEADDNLRRRKIKYHLGEAKDIDTSGPDIAVKDDSDELGDEEDKGYDAFFEEDDLPEDEIDAMVDSLSDDEIVDDAYEDDEFAIVDDETGEELEDEEDKVNEEALMEVLSRMERIRAKQRLRRTKAKRERAEKIALRKYSTTQVVNKRARRLAVKALKKRFTKGRDMSKLSVAEKERLEQRIQKMKPFINRIALKMVPRVRKLEKQRLSHRKFTK